MFGGGFGGLGFGGGPGAFESHYRCYPVSFIDKLDAEAGDKVFLPASALDRLASLHIDYPMLFKVENRRDGHITHCGVLEFIADEGMVYMPYWMMQNMLLSEGDVVKFSNATLPKGTYVKLQPHTQDFLDISNPKAVLERTLRGFSCLTVGDCICLHYNGRKYYIDIIEAKPGNAISVIETDCEVDFAPPLDYVEPQRQLQPTPEAVPASTEAGTTSTSPDAAPEPPKVVFRGSGFRLDGKPVASEPLPPPSSSGAGANGSGGATDKEPPKKAVSGKAVFGGGNRLLSKKALQAGGTPGAAAGIGKQDEKKEEKKEEEGPSFKAFSGKSFSLKG